MHAENLIAHGDQPVLIDLETLLTGEVHSFLEPVDAAQRKLSGSFLRDSVLYSSLLPHRIEDPNGEYPDCGGISGTFEGGLVSCKNLPLYGGKTIPAYEYIKDICKGFKETYAWITTNREKILNESPYSEFANCQIRFLLRSTQVYYNLINRLSQPDMQADPEKYEAQLYKLALAYTKYAHPSVLPKLMPIYEAEAAAIRRGDIPYFTTRADSLAICDENGNVLYDQYFRISAFDRSKRILMNMNERDCEFQTELIRASFHASYPPEEAPSVLIRTATASLSNSNLFDEATTVYDEIGKHNCEMDDGAPAWTMQCGAMEGACGVKMTEIGLYSGRAGVALFDAALYAVTGNEAARKDAERLVHAIFEELKDRESTHLLEKLTFGLANGIGGVFVTLGEIARYLNKPEYITQASAWLDKLTDTWIARDRDYDVIGGSSGLLLGMYHLNANTPEAARRLADHIMENRISYNNHLLIFRPNMDNLPLTGMGHGAAGISCALLIAWRMTGDVKYREAALDMLAYERECYSSEENNWPDFRKNPDVAPDQLVYMHGWCASAPGIGFSRKLINQLDHTIDVKEDIRRFMWIIAATERTCIPFCAKPPSAPRFTTRNRFALKCSSIWVIFRPKAPGITASMWRGSASALI